MTVLTLCSCEKELDFEYHDIAPVTVIEATLDGAGADVTITFTTPMGEPMDRTHVAGADVTLTDDDTGDTTVLPADSEGKYTAALSPVVGYSYTLTVMHQGKQYRSTSRMTGAVELFPLEFCWVGMPYDDVAALQVSFLDKDPSIDGECYWIRLYRNGEAYKWDLVKDSMSEGGIIHAVIPTSRRDTDEEEDDTVLFDGDIMTAAVTAISPEMYDYLAALSSGSNGQAMFTGDFCLGYFMAGESVTADIVFRPDEIPRM